MKKIFVIKLICIGILVSSLLATVSAYPVKKELQNVDKNSTSFDPTSVNVTVEILKIRALDTYNRIFRTREYVDKAKDPDLYVKVFINDIEFTSPVWNDTKYIYNPDWSATVNVPFETEFVTVKIQLWDSNPIKDTLCDIGNSTDDVTLTYDLKTGHWSGDDALGDNSGYGRLNGCDDSKIYAGRGDCELWFNIVQDNAGDGIPAWMKENVYLIDPATDYTGWDPNGDKIPIQWDWKWGYDPFSYDNHSRLDVDVDGIDNYEEYLTSDWQSDPFRQDIFIEVDQMQAGPNGEPASLLPDGSVELLNTAFDRYNKVVHIDKGSMGGGEMIPFYAEVGRDNLDTIYNTYFLHNNQSNWRKGVFRYGLLVYNPDGAGYNFEHGAFVIGTMVVEKKVIPYNARNKDLAYASVFMHETGHTLSLHSQGVDNQNTKLPWQIGFWIYGQYKSTMNYRYTYRLVDYSDGSRIGNDFPDWTDMDLTRFQNPW